MRLAQLLADQTTKLADVEAYLDRLNPGERVMQTIELNRSHQERLWALCEQAPAIGLDYFVPPDAPALRPFPFEGKNSLPAFTRFKKVFYRTKEDSIGGYNEASIGWLIGPGYYVARPSPDAPGPVVIDYMAVPRSRPEGWPEIRPNEAGLTRFVYGFTRDFLRRASKDVVIGRAYRRGESPMPNWFVLCRPS